MQILDDNFMVCSECIQAIANDDYSGLDYHYDRESADNRASHIRNGIMHAGGNICIGDSDKDEEFSTSSCDCCGGQLAGSRHHCVLTN